MSPRTVWSTAGAASLAASLALAIAGCASQHYLHETELLQEPHASRLAGMPGARFEYVHAYDFRSSSLPFGGGRSTARVTGVFAPGGGPPGVAACAGTVSFRWTTHTQAGRGYGPRSTQSEEITDIEVQPAGVTVPDHGVPRPILLAQWVVGRMDMTVEDGRPADVYTLRLESGQRIEARLGPSDNAPAVENAFYNTDFQIYLARGGEPVSPRPRTTRGPMEFDVPRDGEYRLRVTTPSGVPAPYTIGVFQVWDDPNRR